jgi:hypothetical protein
MKKALYLILITSLLAFVSCKKNAPTPIVPAVVTTTPSTVYIAGYTVDNTGLSACYWKDGVITKMTSGVQPAYAYSVFVSGINIYTCGDEQVVGSSYKKIAKVWKNAAPRDQTNGTYDASVFCITESNSDVYACGNEFNGTSFVAKVWKNNIPTNLTNGLNYGKATAVVVVGTDVYVCGYVYNATVKIAMLWKNGVATPLSNGINNAETISMVASGSDVYICGVDNGVTKVWKNGLPISISGGFTGAGSPTSIDVYSNDIYIGGSEYNGTLVQPKVWKNGVSIPTLITAPTLQGQIFDVAFDGTDIYACGYVQKTVGTVSNVAAIWKNGVLDTSSIKGGIAYSISVK